VGVRIERAELLLISMELTERFGSSAGARRARPVLLVTLEAAGEAGWGECVALADPSFTYETTETAWHVLTDYLLPAVIGSDLPAPSDLLRSVSRVRGHPMAKAAVEMAAWDLHAKLEGVSLAQALGGSRRRVEAGVSLGLQPDDDALLERIEASVERGYRRVKVKIAPGRDVETIDQVRSRFPEIVLMVDANGAYSLGQAERLRELDRFGLLMIEQPLAWDDLRDHARLQDTLETPICLDESIRSVEDVELALELGSCRILNVKPGRVGGLANAVAIHDLCCGRDVPVWVGGMLESGIGRAHNVALASLPGFTLPGDLSESRRYWDRDVVDPEFVLVEGSLAVPDGIGIGVQPDLGRIEALTVRRTDFGV
jgi:O-succinylbenzoate synthase